MATRPTVKNVDAAIRAYYGNGYIGNAEIKEIFGTTSPSTISRLKRVVREAEIAQEIPIVVPRHLNVRVAFEVWGIDVEQLVKNRKKRIALNLD